MSVVLVRGQELFLRIREFLASQDSKRRLHDVGVQEFGVDADDLPIGVAIADTMLLETRIQRFDRSIRNRRGVFSPL